MRHRSISALLPASLAAAAALFIGFPSLSQGSWHNPIRHHYVMRNGLPQKYATARSPLGPSKADFLAGQKLYGEHCASCHGKTGAGDGEAGRTLNPPPPAIAGGPRMRRFDDRYLLWTISEGGEALKTKMPAFKEALSLKQRWQVIVFVRRGLPVPPGWRNYRGHGHGRGHGPSHGPGHGRGQGPGPHHGAPPSGDGGPLDEILDN